MKSASFYYYSDYFISTNLMGVLNMENENKPVEEAQKMSQEEKDQILENYNEFLGYLGKQVGKGEKLGMGEDQLAKTAKKLADYLANNVEPRNREEKVLKEMWSVAEDDNEKEVFSKLLVRLAKQKNKN